MRDPRRGLDVVPSIAVSPAVLAHGLLGIRARPARSIQLGVELGLGVTSVWLFPGSGGSRQRDTYASGMVRATAQVRLGTAADAHVGTADVWLGLAYEGYAGIRGALDVLHSVGLELEFEVLELPLGRCLAASIIEWNHGCFFAAREMWFSVDPVR